MTTAETGKHIDPANEERPPVFRSWGRWYAAILIELVILIVLFRIITVVFE